MKKQHEEHEKSLKNCDNARKLIFSIQEYAFFYRTYYFVTHGKLCSDNVVLLQIIITIRKFEPKNNTHNKSKFLASS